MMRVNRICSVSRYIPGRYHAYLFIIFIVCPCIFFVYPNRSSNLHVEVIDNDIKDFNLFDDDDMPFICPSEFQFHRANRQHLVIIVTSKLFSFVWKNFRALLCSGVDVYVMLDEIFLINSSSRVDNFKARTNRSIRSYSHRFLYVTNQQLTKFGVTYMKKLPSIEFTSWDRTVVWLYHRMNLTNVWIIEHDVQWFDVRNLTYLFDLFANNTADLLCDNIVQTNAYWGHWPSKESDIFPKSSWIGTFSPLVRWSRRLLQHHYRYMQLIHKDRLRYEIDRSYRFQEFIMGTIAKIENLSIEVYSQTYNFIHIVLGNMSDADILYNLKHGKYILHPVKQESILTNYRVEDITIMIKRNNLTLTNMTLLEKEKRKQ